MGRIRTIIKEELGKIIKENFDENSDAYYAYWEREDEIKLNIFQDFLYKNNSDFTKHIPWRVISFPRLKKIWEDYMSKGVIRDEKGLEVIKEIMIRNTAKINILTTLAGHTQNDPEEDFQDNIGYFVDDQLGCILKKRNTEIDDISQLEIPFDDPHRGYKEKLPQPEPHECNGTQINPYVEELATNELSIDMKYPQIRKLIYEDLLEKFYEYYTTDKDNKMGGFMSDYGLQPLMTLLHELIQSDRPETDLVIIDKMLNVVHQRSDIANWFVQGGSYALSQLSGYGDTGEDSAIFGNYRMSDYR